ncbi:NAD(P)/FAD-dependent oxidoreductase [Temperatibacter marinus]|uniref:NAD(P)/FAD-dependent oxidoreductase n=1 Tax=Temperatibacter marinus TaxID=1456591 RepID=A0AA52HA25_9PROT|nr:NAD(P)/FAD-dependent oxidoreductase [Temperatibacter marinus]WND03534.1 NAD(P)/FAD-dependent oxidoreductase [Temperatibacter marinus]
MSQEYPVIIAGAGPSGSVLALSLAKAGVKVLLLEKEAQLPIDLRASTFHPPSLEMIGAMDQDIVDAMIDKGLVADRYQYRDRKTGDCATFNMAQLKDETSYPFRLQLEQYELTYLIAEKLKDYPNVEVRYNHEALRFEQTPETVILFANTPEGEVSLTGSFLIGAEGARSNIRKSSGIAFGGFTYDEKFLVVSTSFAFEDVFDDLSYVNYVADPDEWCVILRTEKIWRVLFPTQGDEDPNYILSDEFIQERLHHLHPREGAYDIGHRTIYNVNQRVAETYYQERMVLIGDACHINNPLGGMGMNGGLHDAFNLAPRLIKIIEGSATHQKEFAQYDRQRRELAVKFVQDHTIANKKLMESTDPDVQTKRQKWLMETAADPVQAKEFLLERAMINCVRDSLKVA